MPKSFKRMTLRAFAALLPAAALFGAASVAAESARITPELRSSMASSVELGLTGRIEQRCALSGGQSIDFGELRGGSGARALFGLDCNVPFDINILSARGGLAHATLPMGEGPFAGTLEYDLKVTVPTLRPDPVTVQASFGSSQLLAQRTLSSGEGIAAGGGAVEFILRNPTGAGLLAGRYSETLTLTVTPRM